MPAKSQQQQKFMGLVHAYKKGEVPASKVSSAIKQAAKSMSKKSVKKYAQTDHDDLPKKVSEEKIKSENLVIEFGKSFQKFTRAVHMLGKGITKMTGDKTDERIIQKAFKKHIIPFGRLIDDWNKGQQKNPHLTTESISDKMSDIMSKLAKSLGVKSVVSMHTGKGSLSYFLDDNMEAKKLASMLKKTFKRVRIIPLDKSKGDTANFVVAADMIGL